MVKNLVIVESPAKAKTIEKFLGKDYVVMSSYGHVRDLMKKNQGIDIKNGFKPLYEVSPDKKKLVSELKKIAKEAETVWLASDEDREGEAISWHLVEALKLKNEKTRRIVFHEITEKAILNAIKNPRGIDNNLVDAQQARRVLDRLVGFEISPVLWRKVKPSLSAGRVQSVAVRLIVEREKEIREFVSVSSYKVVAKFYINNNGKKTTLDAELPQRFKTKKEAEEFLNICNRSNFSISNIEKKPFKKHPAAPFTTSTLQQEASRKLGYGVTKTMLLAQKLYESGQITYMRTDSTLLSSFAIDAAKDEIITQYGEEYSESRQYTTKNKGAQEAHEAIRPTYINNRNATGEAAQKKLYELIWKRTIASQMADAQLERTTVKIAVSESEKQFHAKGEVVKFDGFLKVYLESTDEETDEEQKGMLPPLTKGEVLTLNEMRAIQRFSMPPPRYTEASLVKKLEELGIGRPSTYAPTISTVQKRQYVTKGEIEGVEREYVEFLLKDGTVCEEKKKERTGFSKGKLSPTDIGSLVTQFLIEHFENIMNYNFTAQVEEEFDEIAKGQKVWNEMISEFYEPFHKQVEFTIENSDRVKGERILGVDPKTGKNISVRIGRYGPMAQIGDVDDEEKPRFAGLRKNQSIELITLEEALELFKFPKVIGIYEDADVTVAVGRFGPYVKHKSKFVSIPKGEDIDSITEQRAIELIEEKRQKDREKFIKAFEEEGIEVLNGRWGPYIKFEKKNYRVPKDVDAKELSIEDCKKIIKETGTKKKTTRKTKKK